MGDLHIWCAEKDREAVLKAIDGLHEFRGICNSGLDAEDKSDDAPAQLLLKRRDGLTYAEILAENVPLPFNVSNLMEVLARAAGNVSLAWCAEHVEFTIDGDYEDSDNMAGVCLFTGDEDTSMPDYWGRGYLICDEAMGFTVSADVRQSSLVQSNGEARWAKPEATEWHNAVHRTLVQIGAI